MCPLPRVGRLEMLDSRSSSRVNAESRFLLLLPGFTPALTLVKSTDWDFEHSSMSGMNIWANYFAEVRTLQHVTEYLGKCSSQVKNFINLGMGLLSLKLRSHGRRISEKLWQCHFDSGHNGMGKLKKFWKNIPRGVRENNFILFFIYSIKNQ